ncbi:uncharacterized protein [Dendrobates tinctorius]|uniref:uncharacterized protein n=1 Tax=Dendrobates tinctorius TaxID=92724 RepID=UPI003CC9351B
MCKSGTHKTPPRSAGKGILRSGKDESTKPKRVVFDDVLFEAPEESDFVIEPWSEEGPLEKSFVSATLERGREPVLASHASTSTAAPLSPELRNPGTHKTPPRSAGKGKLRSGKDESTKPKRVVFDDVLFEAPEESDFVIEPWSEEGPLEKSFVSATLERGREPVLASHASTSTAAPLSPELRNPRTHKTPPRSAGKGKLRSGKDESTKPKRVVLFDGLLFEHPEDSEFVIEPWSEEGEDSECDSEDDFRKFRKPQNDKRAKKRKTGLVKRVHFT